MNRKFSVLMSLALALVLAFTAMPFALAEEAETEEATSYAYLMYADAAWANQYWSGEAPEGVTAINETLIGAAEYTVGLEFAAPAEGLAFAAIGLTDGEISCPNYTIEIKSIRVNDEEVPFTKGYTSSDDGITTRMNIYNEWVTELPTDARSFDGSIEGASAIIVDKEAFASVSKVEVDFVLHEYQLDTGYVMYADAAWANQYWGGEAPEGITATNAVIDGYGTYSAALEFAAPAEGLAFAALGIQNGEKTYPRAVLQINAIRVNGEEVAFTKGYTSSDDGVTTRMNIYNEWVSALPEDARSFDGNLEEASWIIVDKEAFASVTKVEIDFTLEQIPDTAYLMYADAAWANQYWGDAPAEGLTVTTAEIRGEGTYTVGLEFAAPAEGLAFAAVGITTGEKTYPGYFIDVAEILVNDEAIEIGKGYTSSDDGITTRENIYNEWVSELPTDARRADGNLDDASPIIVNTADFASVSKVEVTFNFIYGKAPEKDEAAPLTAEEAKELIAKEYNAYIGLQTENYIFRNAWNDTYGRDDAENVGFFNRLTGWDADNNAVDYGGTFEDALVSGEGTYTVSVTTGDMGFGSDSFFRLLFVSTEIPSKLVKDGFMTIEDVQIKVGNAATQKYTDIDTSGDYARIVVIDQYNRSEDPFGYTMPAANTPITITFTVTANVEE